VRSGAWRGIAAGGVLIAASLAVTLALLEALLRWVPAALPSGTYSMGQRFDERVQSPVYTGRVVYNKVRRTVREPNSHGFLDLEHAEAKPAGVTRVAFFGDSYVESAQVELDQTFFRLFAASQGQGVEVLAFGISGWGTLHSLLAYRGLAEGFGLDGIVYVFVENDPGDNAWSIMRARPPSFLRRPFAELAEEPPGFRVEWHAGMQAGAISRLVRRGYDRSLLARVVWSRLALLRGYGVASRRTAAEGAMAGAPGAAGVDQNTLPTTWPPQVRDEAAELGRRILEAFAVEAARAGRDFSVLYVPRGEDQLRGDVSEAETWKPWLLETCAALGIPVVDPTTALRAALAHESVYDDHWSPAGHRVVAGVLERAPVAGRAAPDR
jgi:hypothetical protein